MEPLLNIFGHRYLPDEPCFLSIQSGTMVYNRITRKWQNWAALNAKATAESHTWQSREVGIPSILWQLANWNGQRYAPGLDDTEALTSEIVVNGEDWTGATGTTPPTSWTNSVGGTPDFTINTGYIEMTGDATLGAEMAQTLTGTPGTYYVLEIAVGDGTGEAGLTLDGVGPLPLGPVSTGDQARSLTMSLSFPMPADGNVDLVITVPGGGFFTAKFIRCYEEAELTGNPGAGGSSVSVPPNPVQGPFMADGVNFWVNTNDCKVGFDVDADPAADVWLTGQQVCDGGLTNQVKMAISAQLQALGCPKLPCVLSNASGMTAAYSKSQEPDPVVAPEDGASEK